jgi:hypothetical protein
MLRSSGVVVLGSLLSLVVVILELLFQGLQLEVVDHAVPQTLTPNLKEEDVLTRLGNAVPFLLELAMLNPVNIVAATNQQSIAEDLSVIIKDSTGIVCSLRWFWFS